MLALATGAIAASAPAAAFAASARVEGGRVLFDAAAGEVQNLLVDVSGDANEFLTIDDQSANTITPGAGCAQVLDDPSVVNCTLLPATFNLGDGDDQLLAIDPLVPALIVNAGAGDDIVGASAANDTVNGEGGSDTLFGLDGNDTIDGGAGNDDGVIGGAGDDTVLGGTGADTDLDGGSGNDVVDGGPGPDTEILGNNGNDTVRGGDGSDVVLRGGPESAPTGDAPQTDTIDGQAGDDVALSGDEGNDTLLGGPGDDSFGGFFAFNLFFDPGNDAYSGGPGDDSFFASEADGTDTWDGNEGFDFFDALGVPVDVNLSADNVANDGAAGENDNLLNVEDLRGGPANDVLTGGGATRSLDGADGNDTLLGGAASEELFGGSGNDGMNGGGGNDQLFGGDGADGLSGGDGNDQLDGGFGSDTIFGNAGIDTASWGFRSLTVNIVMDGVANDGEFGEGDNLAGDVENLVTGSGPDVVTGTPATNTINTNGGDDVINVRDASTDLVNCGLGLDIVVVDASDRFETIGDERCENVDRGANPFVPGLSITTKTRGRGRSVTVEVTCPLGALIGCQGTLQLRARGARNAGRATFTLPAASSKTITVRLSNAARRRIRSRRRLRVTFTMTVVDASNARSTITRTATLRR